MLLPRSSFSSPSPSSAPRPLPNSAAHPAGSSSMAAATFSTKAKPTSSFPSRPASPSAPTSPPSTVSPRTSSSTTSTSSTRLSPRHSGSAATSALTCGPTDPRGTTWNSQYFPWNYWEPLPTPSCVQNIIYTHFLPLQPSV
ncbi:hypothetical protein L596_011878 [Steinernema carpocapsae]|uniref:Uncharacterized protein n=1 Tax=Steinernema carpocapsae TaxID=34508 RepID=A0A4U5NVE7_STECR|nr:hypothetical protein L596_011878 [Steinernema carpocapsae]